MVFTKQHQERLLEKYLEERPSATALEMQAFIHGVEVGIVEHKNYETNGDKHLKEYQKQFNKTFLTKL